MNVNMEFLGGVIIGFGIVAAVILLLVYALLYRNKEACEYDKRQITIRGKAFKLGFFTLIFYNFLYGMSVALLEKAYIEQATAFLFGIIVAIGVFAIYCIWNDAYVAINRKPKQFMILFSALGVFNLMAGIYEILAGNMLEDGMLNFHSLNLFVGVLSIILLITFALKRAFKWEDE